MEPKKVSQVLEETYSVCTICTISRLQSAFWGDPKKCEWENQFISSRSFSPLTSAQLTSRMFPENYDNFSEKNRKYDGTLQEERDWLAILSCWHFAQDVKTFTPLIHVGQSTCFGFWLFFTVSRFHALQKSGKLVAIVRYYFICNRSRHFQKKRLSFLFTMCYE